MALNPGFLFSKENASMTIRVIKRINPTYVKAYIDFPVIVTTARATVTEFNKINSFLPRNGAKREALWIKVTEITDMDITGVIDTDLMLTEFHGLKDKDIITIKPEHVSQYLQ